ncbi:hypothetical protein Tco_0617048, partial [Tanacetum coccineum]
MFMANLSLVELVYDEARPSHDSNILSEVHDHDNYKDAICEHHEVHEMQDDVQPNYVVDSHADYTSNSNMIPYDQYVKGNILPVVQKQSTNASLTAELVRYKEQAELHERWAKFELNEREQKIEEQLRIIITDRNIKEENLKKELHSIKMQLNSTINHNKVAIGYKNPFYLSKAKQVQPALYNGHEIIKPNYDRALVHDSEDTLEIAETTRKQMLEKMNNPECVKKRVKIAPHNYSKENYLATFTPQKHLTPEHIFWSNDLIKIQAKDFSAKAKYANPNRALTVYHPNIPAKLVPKVLPTKSQVQVNIYSLVQLFLEFDKTCKKRITPTGITERERGFEQTKTCYITEVIPFFKTIKEHFEGIQTALVQEIKEMKEVFEQMEAEVDQHVIDKKYFLTCMMLSLPLKSVLPNLNLKNKIQNDDHDVMIKHFSKLEVEHLNLQLKYQHLEERFRNKKSVTSSDAPTFESVFVIEQLQEQVQSRGNTIRVLKEKISQLTKKHSDADPILDLKALDTQNKDLNAKVNALYDLNERLQAENEKAQIKGKSNCVTMPAIPPKVFAPGMYAINVEPIPPHNRNNKEVHLDYLRHLKESVATLREIVEEARVKSPLDSSFASTCLYTKHSQELLEYAIGTCPKDFNKRDKQIASTSATRKKQVTFMAPCDTSTNNTHSHFKQ